MLLAVLILLIAATLSGGAYGYRKLKTPPTFDAALLIRFALAPGERPGVIWHGVSTSGVDLIATITSYGVFAVAPAVAHGPAMRFARGSAVFEQGTRHELTAAHATPIVEVRLVPDGAEPVTFGLEPRGARAVAAWAADTSVRK